MTQQETVSDLYLSLSLPLIFIGYLFYVISKHKTDSAVSGNDRKTINDLIGLLLFYLVVVYLFISIREIYGSLITGLIEIFSVVIELLVYSLSLYFLFSFVLMALISVLKYIQENSYSKIPKGKNIAQIQSFAVKEIYGLFGLFGINLMMFMIYFLLSTFATNSWIVKEGFIGISIFIAAFYLDFPNRFCKGYHENMRNDVSNFVSLYLEVHLIRIILNYLDLINYINL